MAPAFANPAVEVSSGCLRGHIPTIVINSPTVPYDRHHAPTSEHREFAKPSIREVRGGRLQISKVGNNFATWNVEGLTTDTKLEQILHHMHRLNVGLLAIQETHRSGSDYFIVNGSPLP